MLYKMSSKLLSVKVKMRHRCKVRRKDLFLQGTPYVELRSRWRISTLMRVCGTTEDMLFQWKKSSFFHSLAQCNANDRQFMANWIYSAHEKIAQSTANQMESSLVWLHCHFWSIPIIIIGFRFLICHCHMYRRKRYLIKYSHKHTAGNIRRC